MHPAQIIILAGTGLLLALAIVFRDRLRCRVCGFWTEPGSPINLAVFRIVLFIALFLSIDVQTIVWFSKMPAQLLFAPVGLSRILPHLPINPLTGQIGGVVMLISSAAAALGFMTRFSAGATALLGLYVLGLPHFYGKVNHLHHHLIWFAALMAVSPCADVLSLDAMITSRRRGRRGPRANELKYSLPLRFVWLLMGLIYFFPGFWKLWHVGFSWGFATNIRLQMYAKWSEFGTWVPSIRIDRHPFVCSLLGLGTIAFEVSFIVLVFFRRCRPWLVIAGLTFHNLTGLVMRIWFGPLQAMYVSLINWEGLFSRLRFAFTNSGVADPRDEAIAPSAVSPRENTPVIVVGIALVLLEICVGFGHMSEAWPFASYPAFDFRALPWRQVLTVSPEMDSGQFIELDRTALSGHFAPDRERGLEENLLRIKDPMRRDTRLRAFWQLWVQNHPELRRARSVRFYRDALSTLPEERQRLRRELLYTLL